MPFEINTPKTELSPDAERRIQRHIVALERRLVKFKNPLGRLTIKDRPTERRHTADLVLDPGVDSTELVSHRAGESAEHAARLAIEDIERQLERYMANLRGEPAFHEPSRREPKGLRPATAPASDEDDYDAPPALAHEPTEPAEEREEA